MGSIEPPEFNEDLLCILKRQKCVLGKQKGPDAKQRIRLDKPLEGPEDIKTLISIRGAGQQDFKGLL